MNRGILLAVFLSVTSQVCAQDSTSKRNEEMKRLEAEVKRDIASYGSQMCADNWLSFSKHSLEIDKTAYVFTRYKDLVQTTTTLGGSSINLISSKDIVFVHGLSPEKAKQLESQLRLLPALMVSAFTALKGAFPNGPCSITGSKLFNLNLDGYENSLGMQTSATYTGKVNKIKNGDIQYELAIASNSLAPNKGVDLGAKIKVKGEISFNDQTYLKELHFDINGYVALPVGADPITIDSTGFGSTDISDVLLALRKIPNPALKRDALKRAP